MSVICPLHTCCPEQRRADALCFFPPRCTTIWCDYYDYQCNVEDVTSAPLEESDEPLGFRNVDSCCYVNAVLRALFSLEDVCLELLEVLPTATPYEIPHPIFECFKQLMLKSATTMEGKLVDVIHRHFVDALFIVNERFVGGVQQDASDFFLELYNYLGEAYPHEIEPVLSKYFEGIIRQNVVCNMCEYATETLQSMVVWPLPMTRNGCTLGECLTEYLADEVVVDRECFKCGIRGAVMKKTVVSWPCVFVVCLQRFSDGVKNDSPICFSEIWKPREMEIESDHEYLLQAVVTHLGQTIDFGHYVCQCRCSDGVVRLFNDDRVTSQRWDEFAAQAYLLFFVDQ